MKQTAVDFLKEKLTYVFVNDKSFNELFQQAKAMEKEQIVKASAIAYEDMFGSDGTEYGEEHYNKTFKST